MLKPYYPPPPASYKLSKNLLIQRFFFFGMQDNKPKNILAPKAVLKTIKLGYRHSLLHRYININIFYGHFYIILINKGSVNLNVMAKKKTCTTLCLIV